MGATSENEPWPPLPLAEWKGTFHTLHMWTQMAGKVQLALTPRTNHWWNAALHVTARGLSSAPIPYGSDVFTMTFDFIDQVLRIDHSRGDRREIPLAAQRIAAFYEGLMSTLRSLGIETQIWPMPVEVPDPIRFDSDSSGEYDPASARRCWRIVFGVDAVFKEFRARFIGKCSPVHFFWGSFDLAVTRFSGRLAPPRPDADGITREAYSHECNSAGWWPGGGAVDSPAFYAYASPEPEGLSSARIGPAKAFYSSDMKEFIYRYDDMRAAADPTAALLEFLQSTYEAGANLAKWDRTALERPTPA